VIEVVEHQVAWATRFIELRAAYAQALSKAGTRYRAIEYVGSTSVPGLAAKPIIDVDIIVDAADVASATSALVAIGFEPRGDLGVPGRIAFFTPHEFAPTNTYVIVEGSLSLRNHLAVRDVLRTDADLREAYSAAKRRAATSATDIGEYTLLKNDILDTILARAGFSESDRAEVAKVNRSIAARAANPPQAARRDRSSTKPSQ
jgi:GrpB-like predicted nucleotidyltransferase (UPF0157 family)